MTDEQIIKALECCRFNISCKGCPCEGDVACELPIGRGIDYYAFDLINRQKTEIDILIRKKETLRDELAEKDAEIERLQKEEKALLITVEKMRNEIIRLQNILVNFMDEIYEWGNKNNVDTNTFAQIAVLGNERDSVVKQIKSEAYMEFADKAKEATFHYYDSEIDDVAKELTEKNDKE